MSEALVLEFTGLGEAEYAAVNGQLGIDMQTGEGAGHLGCSRMRPAPLTTAPSS